VIARRAHAAAAATLLAAAAARADPPIPVQDPADPADARAVEPARRKPPSPQERDLPEILARLTGFWREPDPGPRPESRSHWTLLPLVFSNPLMGFGAGAAAVGSYRVGPPGSKFSRYEASAFFTEKGQRGLEIRSGIRPTGDWILSGEWGIGRFPNPTWGLGPDTPDSAKTVVQRSQVRIHETVYRRVAGDWYGGLGYGYDLFYDVHDSATDEGRPSAFTAYGVGTGGRSDASGLMLNALYDARDNPLNPTRGSYLLLRYRFEPGLLGSDQDWRSVYLDGRTYLSLRGRNVIAFWAYAWSSFGETPYLLLPMIGADPEHRSGRGYVEGRYTGKDLLYAEVEWRFHIWDFLGGVVAASALSVSNRGTGESGPLFDDVHPAVAAGLRALLSKESRSNLVLDVGWSPGGMIGFYLNANETF